MRSFALVATLLALLLVLCGCPTTKGTDTGQTAIGPVVGETTEPAGGGPSEEAETATPAEVETHPTAKIAVLKVGDQFDEETEEITNQTRAFSPDTPVIYVSAGITGLTKGEMVKGTLMAVEVTAKDGTEIRDQEVTFTELEAPADESTMQFKFLAPTDGWPVGSYKVDIDGTDKLIETVTRGAPLAASCRCTTTRLTRGWPPSEVSPLHFWHSEQ
jgi:hypothetical protein